MSLNLGTVGHTKHWYIGTRYALNDTYAYMMKTGQIKERRHICCDELGNPVLLSLDEYNKKKATMTSKDWASQMLQTPVGEGELMFKPEWFRQWRDGELPERMNYYMFVDTALIKSKDADFTVMMVIGFGCDRRKYVIDFVRDKYDVSGKTAAFFELLEKYQPSIIFWEANASQELGEVINAELKRRNWPGVEFYAFKQPTTLAKADRICQLEPDFRAGNILFPMELWRTNWVGQRRNLVQDFLDDEYLVMNMGGAPEHDDMLDCLANTKNPDLLSKIIWPITPRREPHSGGDYRGMHRVRKPAGDGLFGR